MANKKIIKLKNFKNSWPGDHCLLCGDRSSVIGVFMPQNPQGWGAVKGKTRFIRYCLCSKCHKHKTLDTIEKVLWAELKGEGLALCQA
jgi:hypothetical protein